MVYQTREIRWQPSMHEFVPSLMNQREQALYFVMEILQFFPRLLLTSIYNCCLRPLPPDYRPDIQTVFRETVSGESMVFDITFHDLVLPDGKHVKATYYRDQRSDENTPVVIRLPGLWEPQMYTPLLDLASKDVPLNFVSVDLPGVGENRDLQPLRKDADIAILAIYAHLKDELGFDDNNIHFWGTSLGGGLALEIKRLLPEHTGIIFCDRSFYSWHAAMNNWAGSCVGTVAYTFLWLIGQDLPSDKTLSELPSGKVRIFNLEEGKDWVLPASCDFLHHQIDNPRLDLSYHTMKPLLGHEHNFHNISLTRCTTEINDQTLSVPEFIRSEITRHSTPSV
jgi:hypothetical protein